jgi:ELWxxDGT repeat protein
VAAQAPAARLVRDINTSGAGSGELLSDLVTIGGTTFFLQPDARYGKELWRTDGTPAGTVLVKDINPGPAESGISSLQTTGGVLYFFADDGTNGVELWRSDGTAAGTRIVADVRAGRDSGIASSQLVVAGGVLYFVGSEATAGEELWRSDGSSAGTWRVADICAGTCASNPQDLVAIGARLFFAAEDSSAGNELWTTDGTVSGTHRVLDINPGSAGSSPGGITPTSAGVFFLASDSAHGLELWFAAPDGGRAQLVSDQTPGPESSQFSELSALGPDVVFGAISVRNPNAAPQSRVADHAIYRASSSGFTQLLSGISLGSAAVVPLTGFVPYGGRLLFSTSDPAFPAALWVTDGTAAGTRRLGESSALVSVWPVWRLNSQGSLLAADGFYFLGYTGPPGSDIDLWLTDGTEGGTRRVVRLPQPFINSDLVQFQGRIYFAGGLGGTHGVELWSTDGTQAGTLELADLRPGTEGSNPSGFLVAGTQLYFIADGQRPWVTDGTSIGTRALLPAASYQTRGSDPQQFTALGNRVLFFATDVASGTEPWVSDGTTAGTQQLKDIYPGQGGSIPDFIGTAAGLVFFSATDASHGTELWASDGTPAGTYLVRDINPGNASATPGTLHTAATLDGVLYFSATDAARGMQLWRSDGTSAGTFAVSDLGAGLNSCMHDLQVLNGRLLFQLCEAGGGFWWVSDGTTAGTRRLSASVTVTADAAQMGGYLYFGGRIAPFDTNFRGQLWRTDGTTAGTTQVTNFDPSAQSTSVDRLFSMPNHVLYQYCAPGNCGLFSSDGTGAGTTALSPDPMTGSTAVVGNRLVYVAIAPTGGLMLRVTDGTVAGTATLVPAGAQLQYLGALAAAQGRVLFTQVDPMYGPSVWRTDGTAAGTALVADVDTGTATDDVPYGYVVAGNQVFFNAYDSRVGTEVFVLDALVPSASDDVATVASGGSTTIPVAANDGSLGSTLNPASVVITSQPGGGSAAVSGAGVVTYSPAAGTFGVDQFTYTIADVGGRVSSPATVFVTVAQPVGPAAGTPPSSTPTAPGSPSSSGGGSSGGGGGQASITSVFLLGIFIATVFRRRVAARVIRRTGRG